jgi:rhodanese-related sulfurtransferase
VRDNLFTGDLLLAGQAGRSDLPGGNTDAQYESLFRKILPLPDSTRIYPGHDYEENEYILLGRERTTNPFLQPRTREEYREFVAGFFPPLAESIAGGAMTLQCGVQRVSSPRDGVSSILPAELADLLRKDPDVLLLDVREPFELATSGAIPGVLNIPVSELGGRWQELPSDTSRSIVVICQSGNRSHEASHWLLRKGYTTVYNLEGGTSAWQAQGHPLNRRP